MSCKKSLKTSYRNQRLIIRRLRIVRECGDRRSNSSDAFIRSTPAALQQQSIEPLGFK